MRVARVATAVVLAALMVGGPALAGPTVIRDDMLQDTAITPALGRGYSIATNTYQSMCLIDVVSTTPSYDFDYTFEEIDNQETREAKAGGDGVPAGIATTTSDSARRTSSAVTTSASTVSGYQLADEWKRSVTTTDLGGDVFHQHLLATISINVYYNSVDETKSKLSPAATKILEGKDIPAFFDACGMYYVRSISRRARIYSLLTYDTTSNTRDVQLEETIKRTIRGFSIGATAKPTTGTGTAVDLFNAGGSADLAKQVADATRTVEMIKGQKYYSTSGGYYTTFQDDGNLCVYRVGTTPGADAVLWCAGTNGKSPAAAKALVQGTDFVILNEVGSVIWKTASNTIGNTGDTQLVMQDDGNLVLQDAAGHALASSNTTNGTPNPTNAMTGTAVAAPTSLTTQGPTAFEIQSGKSTTGRIVTTTKGTNIQISTRAVGLGKQLGTNLISTDVKTFRDAIESAFKATLPENVGRVTAIEVVPWIESTEFQSLFRMEAVTVPVLDQFGFPVMDLTDPAKPVPKMKTVLPYEQKRTLQTNAEFLAEIDRSARAKLNVFYKAKMCRAQILVDYMKMNPRTGQYYFPPAPGSTDLKGPSVGDVTYAYNNRKPNTAITLTELGDILNEPALQRMWMEYDSFMYGGTGDDIPDVDRDPIARAQIARAILLGTKIDVGYPKNVFPGAGRCIAELFAQGITAVSYRVVPSCARIEETFATISGRLIDDYCMPRYERNRALVDIETVINAQNDVDDATRAKQQQQAAADATADQKAKAAQAAGAAKQNAATDQAKAAIQSQAAAASAAVQAPTTGTPAPTTPTK